MSRKHSERGPDGKRDPKRSSMKLTKQQKQGIEKQIKNIVEQIKARQKDMDNYIKEVQILKISRNSIREKLNRISFDR